MIQKAFEDKKELKKFVKDYKDGTLKTEVISNIFADKSEVPEVKDYLNFIYNNEMLSKRGMVHLLMMFVERYAPLALEAQFGKFDFKFEGNRTYKNYVLDFEGLTIIGPSKREVVLNQTKDRVGKLIRFEKAYNQMAIDYMMKHSELLSEDEKSYIQEFKDEGLLDENNQIQFKAKKSKNNLKP